MKARRAAKPRLLISEDGVSATRSAAGFKVCIPQSVASNSQLSLVATVWDIWLSTRSEVFGGAMEWSIDISEINEPSFALAAIMASIDSEMNRAGLKLSIISDGQTAMRSLNNGAHVEIQPMSTETREV